MYLKVFTSLVKLQNPSQRVSVPLPAKKNYQNMNQLNLTQILLLLLLPMKMIKINADTVDVTLAYEDDKKTDLVL